MQAKPTTLSLYQFVQRIPDEQTARVYFEKMRWVKGRYCPHCKKKNTVEVVNEKPQPYRCKDCRKHFSIRTGTVLASSNVPLQKWLLAAYLMNTAKKGVSSCQMARELGVTQKTAWMLCLKVREIWSAPTSPFTGTVEGNETYIGGKEKNKYNSKKLRAGRGVVGKQVIIGLREQTGKVKTQAAKGSDRNTIHTFINENVKRGTTLITDDFSAYNGIDGHIHESANHSPGEYVRGDIHTNGIVSLWSLLKRGYYGTFHHFSPEHVGEFAARMNNVFCDTEDVLAITVKNSTEKSLLYKALINHVP